MMDSDGNEICDHGLELCHSCVKHTSQCPVCKKPFEKMKRIDNFTVTRPITLIERIIRHIEEMSDEEVIEFMYILYMRTR